MSSPKVQPVPARPAATMMLVRDRPGLEVLMVRRHDKMAFGPGALVFPGGCAEPGDADPAWEGLSLGLRAAPSQERALRVAALRETFEECGILLARQAGGGLWRTTPEAVAGRREVARGERRFLDLVRDLGVSLDLEALTLFARWVTPAHMPRRFDTWFYLAPAGAGQPAVADGQETVDAEWIAPAHALRLAQSGARKLMLPTRLNLQLLDEGGTAAGAGHAARSRPVVVVEPRIEARATGEVVTIPPDAGYGWVEEPLEVLA